MKTFMTIPNGVKSESKSRSALNTRYPQKKLNGESYGFEGGRYKLDEEAPIDEGKTAESSEHYRCP
jgi:hypothetical protein